MVSFRRRSEPINRILKAISQHFSWVSLHMAIVRTNAHVIDRGSALLCISLCNCNRSTPRVHGTHAGIAEADF